MTALACIDRPAAIPNTEMIRALASEMARQLVSEQAAQDPRNRTLVSEIFAAFLADKQKRFDQGRLGADGFYNYKLRCRQFLEWKGDGPVSRCRQEDFEEWAKSRPDWGHYSFAGLVASLAARTGLPSRWLAAHTTNLASYEIDAIFIRIGFYLGLRISEIINLDVGDVDLADKTCTVREGKGSKDRTVRIPDNLTPHLAAWIGERKTGALLHRNGKRLDKRTLNWRLARNAKKAGIVQHVHAHMMRHAHAVRILTTGGDIRSVQYQLGHANLSDSCIYLTMDTSQVARDVDGI